MQCEQTTEPRDWSSRVAGHGGAHRCTRRATYTDGVRLFCAQHAKEPATVMRKATGKIRAGMKPLA